jgi:hypothetical protein
MAHVRALYARASSQAEAKKFGLHSLRVTGYTLSKRGSGEELTVAHGGWRSLAHRRYDRFSLDEVLQLPGAMLAVRSEGDAPAQDTGSASAVAGAGAQALAAPVSPLPLTRANCVGRRVLCPRAMWPGVACHTHGGAGWEAQVTKVRGSRDSTQVYVEFVPERPGKPADKPMWLVLADLQAVQ